MQYRQEIHLSEKLINAIAAGADEVYAVVIDELSDRAEIKSILESYDYLNESRGQVHEFKIRPDTIIIKPNGEGSFKVTYQLEFFYACDAITTSHAQEMIITFKADPDTGKALFSGAYIPDREPDEL